MPLALAFNSLANRVEQGPKASMRQPASKGAKTMAPWFTMALTRAWVASTTKSVPLTPMATRGVLSLNLSLADSAAWPEMALTTPLSKSNLTSEAAGLLASKRYSLILRTEEGRKLTKAPSTKRMCTWPLAGVINSSPTLSSLPANKGMISWTLFTLALPMTKVTLPTV